MTRDQIKAAALELDSLDRELLAHDLLDSISDGDPAEIEAAWIEEVERRVAAIDAGEVTCSPADEVIERLQRMIRP